MHARTRQLVRPVLLSLLSATAAGCATTRPPVSLPSMQPVTTRYMPRGACAGLATIVSSRETDYLRASELERLPDIDLATLLRRRRPQWLKLQPEHPTFVQDVTVYLDGARLGGPEVLGSIQTRDVQVARFLRTTAALQRYGRGHAGGVIELYSRC